VRSRVELVGNEERFAQSRFVERVLRSGTAATIRGELTSPGEGARVASIDRSLRAPQIRSDADRSPCDAMAAILSGQNRCARERRLGIPAGLNLALRAVLTGGAGDLSTLPVIKPPPNVRSRAERRRRQPRQLARSFDTEML